MPVDTNLTKEEKEFVIRVLKQININVADPGALGMIALAQSVLAKLSIAEPVKTEIVKE